MDTAIKHRGAVFTPDRISKYMCGYIKNDKSYRILEPSCGHGDLLKNISTKHNITAVDINKKYVAHCKKKYPDVKYHNQNFLDFKADVRYDYVIGNPPYVKVQNLPVETRQRLRKEYPDLLGGNTNLYVYFILKCLDLLKDDGTLVFICPNGFLYSKSLVAFRNFLFSNKLVKVLVDFGDKQIFDDVSTYTCILVLTKRPKTSYLYGNDIGDITRLVSRKYTQQAPLPNSNLLSVMRPKIGLMTLCDDVFIIKEHTVHGDNLVFEKHGKMYEIEKGSCKNILKVSKKHIHKIIYPYVKRSGKVVVDESFDDRFPKCFAYLSEHRALLAARDGGKAASYPCWYMYGRSQGVRCFPSRKRLFLSTIVDKLDRHLCERRVDLYYSGLWLEPISVDTTNDIIRNKLVEHEQTILGRSGNKSDGWYMLSRSSFE
jgi:adenine-specific DNA-methyltransferase